MAITLVWSAAPAAGAEDEAPSNLDLMSRLGTQVANDIIGKIDSNVRGVRLQVAPFAGSEEYQLLDDIFTRILQEKGIETVTAQPKAGTSQEEQQPPPPFVLDYKVPIFRLSYPKVYRSYLIGGKKVRREATLRVSVKLLSDKGDVVWIGESSAEHEDQFPYGDRERVQEGTYQFVKPEMPGSGWGKIVEPVFVSAIIVGMIYLFFSNQSDS
jgi:hypothetical protein